MKITLKLFATLVRFGPEVQEIIVPEGTTVADVIKKTNISDKIPLLRILNGIHVPADHVLREGDILALFPPIGGG